MESQLFSDIQLDLPLENVLRFRDSVLVRAVRKRPRLIISKSPFEWYDSLRRYNYIRCVVNTAHDNNNNWNAVADSYKPEYVRDLAISRD